MDRNAIDRRRGSHICRACGAQSGWSNPGHPDSDFACSIGTFMPHIIGFAGNSADADMPEEVSGFATYVSGDMSLMTRDMGHTRRRG